MKAQLNRPRRMLSPSSTGQQRYKLLSRNPLTGRTEKFTCPCCGQVKRFTRFWDYWRNEWSADHAAGKCDRVESCGYYKYPDRDAERRPDAVRIMPVQAPQIPLIPLNYMYDDQVTKEGANGLKNWFFSMFDKDIVNSVWRDMGAVAADAVQVIYWQFDRNGTAVTASAIQYKEDGHRVKDAPKYWAHKSLNVENYQPQKHLFGLRYAMTSTAVKVAVMESEKSALLCECARRQYGYLKDYTFTATGGATMLDLTLTADLDLFKGRQLVLFPDSDAAGRSWLDKAKSYHAQVDDRAHGYAQTHEAPVGFDIGDLVADAVTGTQRQRTAKDGEDEPNRVQLVQLVTEGPKTPPAPAKAQPRAKQVQPTADQVRAAAMSDSMTARMIALNPELIDFLSILELMPATIQAEDMTPPASCDQLTAVQMPTAYERGGNSEELASFLMSIGFAPDWQPPLYVERETQLLPF